MNMFVVFVLVVLVVLLVALAYREGRIQGEKAARTPEQDAQGQTAKKHENKQRLIALLKKHGELSNADIRKKLNVSSRTVVNYLDELEQEGQVKQVGDVGQGVVYRLK